MSPLHDCPLPIGQTCPHSGSIQSLQNNLGHILERLNELRDDVKYMKTSLNTITKLEQDNLYSKEAMGRAFDRIGILEKAHDAHEAELQQFKGARAMLAILWTVGGVAAGAVVMAVLKLTF